MVSFTTLKNANAGSVRYSVKNRDTNKIKQSFSKTKFETENRGKTSDAEGENLQHCNKK